MWMDNPKRSGVHNAANSRDGVKNTIVLISTISIVYMATMHSTICALDQGLEPKTIATGKQCSWSCTRQGQLDRRTNVRQRGHNPSQSECRWNLVKSYTSIHTYTHTQTYIPIYLPTYLHTYLPRYLRTYVPTYTRTYIHTYIHTYLHTYIPTYQHTNIPPPQATGGDQKNHTTTTGHRRAGPEGPYHHPSIHPYIHIHTHRHAYLSTYLPTHLHTYIPTYLRTYVHTYIHIHTHRHTYLPTYLHTYIPTYLRTYVPTYTRTYIHTYQHTNIPTYHHHRPRGGGTRRTIPPSGGEPWWRRGGAWESWVIYICIPMNSQVWPGLWTPQGSEGGAASGHGLAHGGGRWRGGTFFLGPMAMEMVIF